MDNNSCYITHLPEDVLRYIFELYARQLTDSIRDLMLFSQLNMVSKKFNTAMDESLIESHFTKTILRKFAKHYLPGKIKETYMRKDITEFRRLFNSLYPKGSYYATKIYREYFWKALEEADVQFMQEYIGIGSSESVLSSDKILNAIEVANQRTDDKFAMVLWLLPYLVSMIPDVDQRHVDLIKLALMCGINLTIEAEFKAQLTHLLNEQKKVFKSPAASSLSSELLLPLLEPKKQKVIVPKGRILGPTKATDLYARKGDFKKHKPNFIETNFVLPNDEKYQITYIDAKSATKVIQFAKKGNQYQYDGLSTPNLYELFVRTSIFSQILDSFPHQHVAFTEEAMKLPVEQQPWFFGALTDEEVERIVSGAAGKATILMRSVGATIWIHFSKSDRSSASVEPYCFHYTKSFWVLFNTEEFHKRCFRFQTAFYNNGYVKDLPAFQFFHTLDGGNFDKIKRVFSAKRLFALHPSFRHQNVLLSYLKRNSVAKEEIVQWILDMEFPIDVDLKTMAKLLHNPGLKVQTIKRVWDMRSDSIDITTLVTKFLTNALLTGEHYWEVNHSRSDLVNLAWRFGNDDNFFKSMPPEIIAMIRQLTPSLTLCEEIAEYLLENLNTKVEFFTTGEAPTERQIKFGRLLCNNFDKFTVTSHQHFLQELVLRLTRDRLFLRESFAMLRYYIPKMKIHYSKEIIGSAVPNRASALHELFHMCLWPSKTLTIGETPRSAEKMQRYVFEVLKSLLDIEPLRNSHMNHCKPGSGSTPCFWSAIKHTNVRAIEYLVSNKWMPLENSPPNVLSAAEYAVNCGHTDLVELLIEGTTTHLQVNS